MRLHKNDVVEFRTADGAIKRGSAVRYDVRRGEIVVKVNGAAFRWEGGPPGEDLDAKGNLIPGQLSYADSLWIVPVASVLGITPAREYGRTG